MTSPAHVRDEIAGNLEVLLLLMFMVAGIYFMKQLLLFVFTRLLLGIRSKMLLSLAFCTAAAFLSAFLDALTVVAVVISVAVGFYGIYHRVASARPDDSDLLDDSHIEQHYREVLEQFRGFLRSLMMHAGVGTALGGVMTMVGEPQNDYRQSRGLAFWRVLSSHGARDPAGDGLRSVNLSAGRKVSPVWLRRTATADGAQGAAGV